MFLTESDKERNSPQSKDVWDSVEGDTKINHQSDYLRSLIFRLIRAGSGSGHHRPAGWLLYCHGDAAAGVTCPLSPNNLATGSAMSLLWVSGPRRWLDPTVTKEELLPITLITSSPK